MRKTLIVIAALVLIGGPAYFFVSQLPAKSEYDELRNTIETPVFRVKEVDSEDREFIGEVRKKWSVRIHEDPDPALLNVFTLLDAKPSVKGMVEVYSRDIPPYSFFDSERNRQESVNLEILSVITPITTDKMIYYGEGFAYLKLRPYIVEYFEDVDGGVKSVLYCIPRQAEQDGTTRQTDE